MGLFDALKQAFENREFDDRTANAVHILLKDRGQAIALKERIDRGDIAFADAARQFSTCPSRSKGGSLGTFSPGQMVPAFDDVCFNPDTEIGAVNVVSTSFGTHLVKVLERAGEPRP